MEYFSICNGQVIYPYMVRNNISVIRNNYYFSNALTKCVVTPRIYRSRITSARPSVGRSVLTWNKEKFLMEICTGTKNNTDKRERRMNFWLGNNLIAAVDCSFPLSSKRFDSGYMSEYNIPGSHIYTAYRILKYLHIYILPGLWRIR